MYYNIDERCPEIRSDNWEQCCKNGWRHIGNAKQTLAKQNSNYINYLQFLHGVTNVTIGQPFSDEAFKPSARDRLSIGIYVRDVNEMVSNLYDEISKWETA